MGGTKVGGNPTVIGQAAHDLHATRTTVATRPTGITAATAQGAGGCGDAHLSAALNRFGAAYAQFTEDVGTELHALATLADSASSDLHRAGGE